MKLHSLYLQWLKENGNVFILRKEFLKLLGQIKQALSNIELEP